MANWAVKAAFIAFIVGLWCIPTYWAIASIRRIVNIRQVDAGSTFRLVWKAMNPFGGIVERLREPADLQLSLTPQEGYTFVPQGGERISPQALADLRQYLLLVANPASETLKPIELRLQFPYPVQDSRVSAQSNAEGVSFAAVGMEIGVAGTGSLQVNRRPLSRNYLLRIAELRPEGSVGILLTLNSWRDPRGKTIPPGEEARYFIPEVTPQVAYIHGRFFHDVGDEQVPTEYYAPLLLSDTKVVSLGPRAKAPKDIAVQMGFE
jgi:hypothetical protein